MKLAVVSPFPPNFGGISTYGSYVSNAIAKLGDFEQVVVLADQRDDCPRVESHGKLTVHRVWREDSILAAPVIAKHLFKAKADVIWFNFGLTILGKSYVANGLGLLLPRLMSFFRHNIVLTMHNIIETTEPGNLNLPFASLIAPLAKWLTRRLLIADKFICLCNHHAQILRIGHGRDKVDVIRHPIYYKKVEVAGAKKQKILFFGAMTPLKGIPRLIEIFRMLQQSNKDLELVIAGSDGRRFPGYFAALKDTYKNVTGISWLQNVSEEEIPSIFSAASMVVLPYKVSCGVSGVLHQACAFGKPIFVTDLPEIRAVMAEEGITANIIPASDEEFVSAIQETLNSSACAEQVSEINAMLREACSLEAVATQYIRVMEAVAGRKHVTAAAPVHEAQSAQPAKIM